MINPQQAQMLAQQQLMSKLQQAFDRNLEEFAKRMNGKEITMETLLAEITRDDPELSSQLLENENSQ